MTRRTVRVFVSSPSDVALERGRAERVARRLSGLFDRLEIDVYRWERSSYFSAHEGFQPQIPDVDRFDLVVGLFWSRLGSALPPDFQPMPDGRPYPSGTAFEILRAIERRRRSPTGRPDVLIYRKTAPPRIPISDRAERARRIDDLAALDAFVAEWFADEIGGFRAAFTPFESPDTFEEVFEAHLRAWLRENHRLGRERAWRVEERGAPFPGLDAFDAGRRAVFFGRRADVERARERLEDAAARGCAFLLIDGASGAGKSSLARAGLLPRIADLELDLRRAVLRPAAAPLAALARALFAPHAAPELAQGDFPTPDAFAAHLAGGGSAAPLLRALDRAAEAQRAAEGRRSAPALRLLLLVDELEALFAGSVAAAERRRFLAALSDLARSGRAAVVATLRADWRMAALGEPDLARLVDEGATLTLAPPGRDALAEIVRAPARAAGIAFERGPDGFGLDEILLREAGDAGALPLLQFTLQALYQRAVARIAAAGRRLGDVGPDEPVMTLTLEDHRRLGGIEGIVNRRAEAAFASLPGPAQAALPRLVRALVEPGPQGAQLLRPAVAATVAEDAAGRELVEALAAARILVRDGDALRFSHEAALTGWERAREAAAEAETFLAVRAEVERQAARWRAQGRRRSLLLPPGRQVFEAEAILRAHRDELSPAARRFIERSGERARLGRSLAALAAVLFACVAAAALWQSETARRNALLAEHGRAAAAAARDDAEQALRAATAATDALVFDLAQAFEHRGLPSRIARAILDEARALQSALARRFPDDPSLLRSRAAAFGKTGDLLMIQGDPAAALDVYEAGLALSRRLAREDPSDAGAGRSAMLTLLRIGDLRLAAAEGPAALAAYEEALAIALAMLERGPHDPERAADVALGRERIGDARLRLGDLVAARASYDASLAVRRRLVARRPLDALAARDLSVSLERVGDMLLRRDDDAGALARYRESLAIRRGLATAEPGNTEWARNLMVSLNKIGDLRLRTGAPEGALAAFGEAVGIARALLGADGENDRWRRDLAIGLDRLGDARAGTGDRAGAEEAYAEALRLRRAGHARDPGDARWETDLVVSLYKLATLRDGDARRDLIDEALDRLLRLERRGALSADQAEWIELLEAERAKS